MNGDPRQITVILGDDSVAKETAILTAVREVRDRFGQITEEHYDSTAESAALFLQRYLSPSLFQETRVFMIRHAQNLTEPDFRELKDILDYRVPDAFLVIEAEPARGKEKRNAKLDAWLKTFKTRAAESPERFLLSDYPKPPPYKIPEWVISQAQGFFKRRIAPPDAQFLVDLVGEDLGSLMSELRKIDLDLAAGKPITRTEIEEICGATRTASPDDLAEALGRKDMALAMTLIDNLFATNTGMPYVVSSLFRHFWTLLRIRKWAEAHRDEAAVFLAGKQRTLVNEIALRIGVAAGILTPEQGNRVFPAIIKSGIVNQARSFKEPHLKTILRLLKEFDVDTKSGRIDPTPFSLQTLCYRIVRAGELDEKKP